MADVDNTQPPHPTATTPTTGEKDDRVASNSPSASHEPSSEAEANRNDNSNPQQGGTGINSASSRTAGATDTSTTQVTETPEKTTATASAAPAPPRASLKVPPFQKDARKLFVGGLPSDITDGEFRSFFEQFGEVIDSIVMIDYETHRSRGFGFVTFKDPEVARGLLYMGRDEATAPSHSGRMQMREKWIEIKPAEPKQGSSSRYGGGARGGVKAHSRFRNGPSSHATTQYRGDDAPSVVHSAAAVAQDTNVMYQYPDYGAAVYHHHAVVPSHAPSAPCHPYYAEPAHTTAAGAVYMAPVYFPQAPPYTGANLPPVVPPVFPHEVVDPTTVASPVPPHHAAPNALSPCEQPPLAPPAYAVVPMVPTAATAYGPYVTPVAPPVPYSALQHVSPGLPVAKVVDDNNNNSNAAMTATHQPQQDGK